MSGNEEKIKQNIDNVIQLSLKGEGPLTEYLDKAYNNIESKLTAARDNKLRRSPGAPAMSDAEIKAKAAEEFQVLIDKKLKPAMEKAAKGETGEAGIEEIAGLASAANGVMSAAGSGSILGLLASIPSLISNSIIGDYVKAGISYFFGGENKPKSFSEALEQVRFERGMDELAKGVETDAAALKAAMLADPAENKARLAEMNRAEQEALAKQQRALVEQAEYAAAIRAASNPPPASETEAIDTGAPQRLNIVLPPAAADGTAKPRTTEPMPAGDVAPAAPADAKKDPSVNESQTASTISATPTTGASAAPTTGQRQPQQAASNDQAAKEAENPTSMGIRTPEATEQQQQLAYTPLANVVVGLQRYTEEMATFASRAKAYFDPNFDRPNGPPPEGRPITGDTNGPAKNGPDLLV